MADLLNDRAREFFGLEYLYPWQRLAVSNILEGIGYFGEGRRLEAPRRNLVILPTGAGKSLCFLLPALMGKGITLILYPLLALMNDQERRLEEKGHRTVLFRGGQNREERDRLWGKLERGESRLILTNPETAGTDEFRKRLEKLTLAHLVIDEVHTVPLWGETFREGLLASCELASSDIFPVVTAFTATASPPLQEEIGRMVFGGRSFHRIMANPDRDNISYHIAYTPLILPALEEVCRREEKPLLVFCRTRAGTEETARFLDRRLGGSKGIARVRFYHAGMEREEKRETEDWFLNDSMGILCATSAYGMGVDARSLKTVIHRDIPPTLEAYIQEAGRAGRSGGKARAILLAPPHEEREGDGPVEHFVYARGICRRAILMAALGWHSEYCGGCDVCTPCSLIPSTEKLAPILDSLIRRYGKAFTRSEWTDFLKGYDRNSYFYRSLKGFSLLADWESDTIREFLDSYNRAPLRGLKDRKRFYVKGFL